VLATDLLVGIFIGMCVKILIHLINGVPLLSLVRLKASVTRENNAARVAVRDSAIFTTWIPLRKRLDALKNKSRVVLDLSDARLVDHTVMAKLGEMRKEFKEAGSELVIDGLDHHRPFSHHPEAARKAVEPASQRVSKSA
jgi:MFS superfamily sulfate permease-like transporter